MTEGGNPKTIKDTRVGRRGMTVLNKELNIRLIEHLEQSLLNNTINLENTNKTLLLILKQLESITGVIKV